MTESYENCYGTIVYIDEIEYYIKEVDKILGILLQPFQPVLTAV
ncbi:MULTISPECIES: hypothetical protein [Nostocaceae]|nr:MULTISPECIES: hypothetical protein [Nostocaceae]